MSVADATAVGDSFRTHLLGQALNACVALTSLALHPALAGSSALSASVLRATCATALLPGMCGLLAYAKVGAGSALGDEGAMHDASMPEDHLC